MAVPGLGRAAVEQLAGRPADRRGTARGRAARLGHRRGTARAPAPARAAGRGRRRGRAGGARPARGRRLGAGADGHRGHRVRGRPVHPRAVPVRAARPRGDRGGAGPDRRGVPAVRRRATAWALAGAHRDRLRGRAVRGVHGRRVPAVLRAHRRGGAGPRDGDHLPQPGRGRGARGGVLDEPFTAGIAVGFALVLLGSVLATRKTRVAEPVAPVPVPASSSSPSLPSR